ncbi:MAG: NAD(P)/FAD-dependent oxidoreductase [Anaerolineales bacterium]|nr:NAD(P)/FAD-dependent oxidoreductase [Anaerolineales bacterium]
MPKETSPTDPPIIVIGGGPAGLTAAYELTKQQQTPLVLEKYDKVGGIARTENYRGYHFDMGGHRFFTKSAQVQQFWQEVLGDDFLRRPRLSRIFYKNKYFHYPLKPFNALWGLGPFEGVRIITSYVRWHLFPYKEEETFEQWVTNRFGRRLFETFFKSYTEKVWGIPCDELKAEWAAQRIKDLSLKTAIAAMFLKPQETIKTLIEEFDYPRRGPGMLWTAVQDRINAQGGQVQLNSNVVGIQREGLRITGVTVERDGRTQTLTGSSFISSMPVTQLLQWLDPPPPPHVLQAANQLAYRDFLTVCLIIKKKELFPDNWIYIHDPSVQVGRIQNFKNWSADMVPDQTMTSLGLEYFCNEGDEIWNMPDEALVALGKREIAKIGLAQAEDVVDGVVFRVEKTYPVYDSDYVASLETIKAYLATLENLQTIGRNGLHRYNNQDHAMLTGMLAVRNLLYGEKNNLWQVNAEQEYHEELMLNQALNPDDLTYVVDKVLPEAFPKLDPLALGMSLGTVLGVGLMLATFFVLLRGGDVSGQTLTLLNQFYPGYTVTAVGGLVGLMYAFVTGFVLGSGYAFLRNAMTALYLVSLHRSAQQSAMQQFFEHI